MGKQTPSPPHPADVLNELLISSLGAVNVKVTSPNPDELTVQNNKDTHTQGSEYRALTPGIPQQGQLLSPRQDREGFESGADG